MPVLEALVAVGLAGNVVQFCETVAGVASQAVAIQRNEQHSSLQELKEQGMKGLKLAALIMDQISAEPNRSEDDEYLLVLATECQKAGNDFLSHLDTFDPASVGGQNFLQSAQSAIKFRWNHHKIMDFSAKLDKLRDVLILSTTLALRASSKADNGTVVSHLKRIQSQSDDNSALLQTLAIMFETESSNFRQARQDIQQMTQDCIKSISTIRSELPQTRENRILRWLNFRQMMWRYEEVPAAFEKTFEWLYHDQTNPRVVWDSFKGHLERRDVEEPYWINGKAGSGKSTLMKFIVDRPETHAALKNWVGADELMVIKFFFWNLGTPLQKSVLGLLRAILCAVLEKHPELIPAVFPASYQAWSVDSMDGDTGSSYSELKKGLEILLARSAPFLKICMFIDGIDELEGDHKDLSLFLRSLAQKVKLIVSSRPITGCISAFNGCPTLQLQDLTIEDMDLFVHANLSTHRSMVAFGQRFQTKSGI